MKLNELIEKCNVVAYGFKSIKDYCANSNPNGNSIVVATDSPAMMYERGINDYFAPIIPRNSRFISVDDVYAANLNVQHVAVFAAPADKTKLLDTLKGGFLANPPQEVLKILKAIYPNAPIMPSVVADDIKGKHVIGTLPPALAGDCTAYTAVTIKDFDYARDNELNGQKCLIDL